MSEDEDNNTAVDVAPFARRTAGLSFQNDYLAELQAYIERTKQWTFFDFGFRTGDIAELQRRVIPEPHLHKVISIYASLNLAIQINVKNETSKKKTSLSKNRLYRCSCGKHYFNTRCLNPAEDEQSNLQYRVFNVQDLATDRGCQCSLKPTAKMKTAKLRSYVIANHPSVRDLVRKNVLLTRAALVDMIKMLPVFQGVPLPSDICLTNMARDLKLVYHFKMVEYYHLLPEYLLKFSSHNPGATVALQSDQNDQFYRLFVGFPIAKFHGIVTLPILVVDCFHYQCPQYDGTAIVMATKNGFGHSIFLAHGIIPTEDTNSVAWFLQMCGKHGIDYAKSPLFTDQGPLLSAARILTDRYDYTFIIMLCLQHLLRNVRHRFPEYMKGPDGTTLETSLRQANQVTSIEDFFDVLTGIVEYCAKVFPHDIDNVVKLGLYIAQYHPSHWTTFANLPDFDDAEYRDMREQVVATWFAAREADKMFNPGTHTTLKSQWSVIKNSNRIGEYLARQTGFKKIVQNVKPAPLFYVSTTNVAESGASAMYRCGGRCYIPPLSMIYFFKQYNAQLKTLMDELRRSNKVMLTSIGTNIAYLNNNLNASIDYGKTVYTIHSTDENENNATESILTPVRRNIFDANAGSDATLTGSQSPLDSTPGTSEHIGSTVCAAPDAAAATIAAAAETVPADTAEWLGGGDPGANGFTPATSASLGRTASDAAAVSEQPRLAPNDYTTNPDPFEEVVSEHSTTVTGIFAKQEETYKAKLSWQHSLAGEEDPFLFEYSCEHHKEITNMFCSPCRCIQALAQHSIERKCSTFPDLNMSFQSLFPPYFQSKRTYELLHEKEDGVSVADSLYLTIPSYNSVKSQSTSGPHAVVDALLNPVVLPLNQVLEAAPKYKNGIAGRRVRSRGEKKNSSVPIKTKKRTHQEGGRFSSLLSQVVSGGRAPRNQVVADAVMADQQNVFLSEDVHAHVRSKLHNQTQRNCCFCGKHGHDIEACTFFHSFGRGVTERSDLEPNQYWVYKLSKDSPERLSSVTPATPVELYAGQYDASEFDLDDIEVNICDKHLKSLVNKANNDFHKIGELNKKEKNKKETEDLYTDVDMSYLDQTAQIRKRTTEKTREPISYSGLKFPMVSDLQTIILSRRDPSFSKNAKQINNTLSTSPRIPLGTIVSKQFDGVRHEGALVRFSPWSCYYGVQYQDGDTEEYTYNQLKKLVKGDQSFTTLDVVRRFSPCFDTTSEEDNEEGEAHFETDDEGEECGTQGTARALEDEYSENNYVTPTAAQLQAIAEPTRGDSKPPPVEPNGTKGTPVDANGTQGTLVDARALEDSKPSPTQTQGSLANLARACSLVNQCTNEERTPPCAEIQFMELRPGTEEFAILSQATEDALRSTLLSQGMEATEEDQDDANGMIANSENPCVGTSFEENHEEKDVLEPGNQNDTSEPGNRQHSKEDGGDNTSSGGESWETEWHFRHTRKGYQIQGRLEVGDRIAYKKMSSSVNETCYYRGIVKEINPQNKIRPILVELDQDCKQYCYDFDTDPERGLTAFEIQVLKFPRKRQHVHIEELELIAGKLPDECLRGHQSNKQLFQEKFKELQDEVKITSESEGAMKLLAGGDDGIADPKEDLQPVLSSEGTKEDRKQPVLSSEGTKEDRKPLEEKDCNEAALPDPFSSFLSSFPTDETVILTYPFSEHNDEIESASNQMKELGWFDERARGVGTKKPSTFLRDSITPRSFRTLDDETWLNDEVVTFWMNWIRRNDKKHNVHIVKTTVFSCFRFGNEEGRTLAIEHFGKGRAVAKRPSWQERIICIPIQYNQHWSLCCVINPGATKDYLEHDDPPLRCMIHFDSKPGCHVSRSVHKHVLKLLNVVHKKQGGTGRPFTKESTPIFTPDVPRQSNGFDCGLFVCRYALAMYQLRHHRFTWQEAGLSHPSVASQDTNNWCTAFSELITDGDEFQFSQQDMPRIRLELKQLIKNLHPMYAKHIRKTRNKYAANDTDSSFRCWVPTEKSIRSSQKRKEKTKSVTNESVNNVVTRKSPRTSKRKRDNSFCYN